MAVEQRLAHERISTARQGANALSLEAQREVKEDVAVSRGAEVLLQFTQVESGRKAERPEPAKALHLPKAPQVRLVIAKLQRLSRNAAFLLALRVIGVRFLALDMSEANVSTVGKMALVAQAECHAISGRTKEALAVVMAGGMKPGNPNGGESLRWAGKAGMALRDAAWAHVATFAADRNLGSGECKALVSKQLARQCRHRPQTA